jgi:hypothetical protein
LAQRRALRPQRRGQRTAYTQASAKAARSAAGRRPRASLSRSERRHPRLQSYAQLRPGNPHVQEGCARCRARVPGRSSREARGVSSARYSDVTPPLPPSVRRARPAMSPRVLFRAAVLGARRGGFRRPFRNEIWRFGDLAIWRFGVKTSKNRPRDRISSFPCCNYYYYYSGVSRSVCIVRVCILRVCIVRVYDVQQVR